MKKKKKSNIEVLTVALAKNIGLGLRDLTQCICLYKISLPEISPKLISLNCNITSVMWPIVFLFKAQESNATDFLSPPTQLNAINYTILLQKKNKNKNQALFFSISFSSPLPRICSHCQGLTEVSRKTRGLRSSVRLLMNASGKNTGCNISIFQEHKNSRKDYTIHTRHEWTNILKSVIVFVKLSL